MLAAAMEKASKCEIVVAHYICLKGGLVEIQGNFF